MGKDVQNEIRRLELEISRLKEELRTARLKADENGGPHTVIVPDQFTEVFTEAEKNVREYFSQSEFSPENAEILFNGERYVLMRSAAISHEFLDVLKELYSNKSEEEAVRIGNNFLFDIAHVLGKEDAKQFHKKMKVEDPVQKLSAGPVHFAFTGWANVEMFPECNPSPDESYFLKFHHHNSFEAQSWIKANRKSETPVCIMNSGYSSGWCEESFGMPLTAVEISCEAQGADHCTFIMAPPDKIHEYLDKEKSIESSDDYDVPVFFQRKFAEEKLRDSLSEKETLLKEVHHRVKNNLQIISSLLNLQQNSIKDKELRNKFQSSILRVNTMAKIHEMIYGNEDLSSIHMEDYFSKLLHSLGQIYGSELRKVDVELKVEVEDLILFPDKAIPLGLIFNEIATNSFKYAFDKQGKFYLRMIQGASPDTYTLTIGDTGNGLPDDYNEDSLGLSLISILCEQIDARLNVNSSSAGLEYVIEFTK